MAKEPSRGTSTAGIGESWPDSTGSASNPSFGSMTEQSATSGASDDKGLISKASEKLHDTAEQQKAAGANLMSEMAGAVRRAAGEFDSQVPLAADYIRHAADQMDSMSNAVRQRDIGQIVSELQSLARRQPTAFLGATFLAGFAAVRFFKSSSSSMRRSDVAMRAPGSAGGMAPHYSEFSGRTADSPVSPSGL